MEQTVTLRVNGDPHTLTTEPERTLLDVLRNELDLKGSRFGCGVGLCGACVVLVDGSPVPSCDTPMWTADGTSVTTVEGLGEEGALHRMQQAVLDEQAAQCAYCMSGILVSAAALLAEHPSPDEHRVATALDRHLCRCGAHPRVVRAVARAAAATVEGEEG
ncbi:MAG: (2Fe-2S)-binding protein [Actinomycetes bacterium]